MMIWAILLMNALTMAVAFRKRMILYALFSAIFAFLVTGQAFQMQAELDRYRTVTYLFNFVSDVGFELALRYVLGISSVSLFLAVVSRRYERRTERRPSYRFDPSKWFYFSLFSFLVLVSTALIFLVVGLDEFLHSSRPGYQSGATIFIVLLFLGVLPVMLKILCLSKIGRGDWACFLLSFAVSGAFSRIHLILYLTGIMVAYFYASGWADRPISPALVGRVLLFGTVAGVTFFGIGALHDAQNFVHGSMGDLIGYILANPEKSVLSIEYNYRVGVEGMSGIAGAFSQSLSYPYSVHHDYGLSSLMTGVVLTLPGFLKSYAEGLTAFSDSLNWYPFSIVATGAETLFMSFGWLSVLLYPLATYFIGWYLPLRVQAAKPSPLKMLIANIFFGCSIFFVRGSIATWIAFSASYAVITVVAWPFVRPYLRKLPANPASDVSVVDV